MKDIFELASTASADVTVLTPKVISATIEEIRRGKRVLAQFYRTNTDLKTTGGTQVEFPAKGSGVVVTTNMSPGNTITTSAITYTATTIAVQKHGVGLGFYGEATRQVKRDIIRDAIQEAGEAYADAMDTLALEAMFPTVNIVGTTVSTIDASGTLVIGIKSTVGIVTSMFLNSTMSQVIFGGAGTVVAWYIPTTAGGRTLTATAGSLSAKDILLCKSEIVAYNFEPDVVIVNPKRLPELFYDPSAKFLEAWAYRGAGPLFNGEVGQMWGLKVIVTNKAPIFGAILIDSRNLGYDVQRLDLDLKRDEITGLSTDMLYFYGFCESKPGVVNPRAFGAVALSGTWSPLEVNATR